MNHLTKLITLNNKLVRVLQQKSTRTHVVDLYRTYSTLPIQLLHNYQILVFMHKYVHHRSKLPPVFYTYFDENKLIHRYNTRQRDDFHTYSVQSETGKRAIKFKGSKLWNNLPTDIKKIQSSSSFKNRLKVLSITIFRLI
jgi:hypothetical protein